MRINARTVVIAVISTLALTGCPEIEDPAVDDPATPVTIDSDIVGTWSSEGADVAPLLAANDVVRVDATFEVDGTYSVVSEDSAGSTIDFSGTYSVDETTDPATILLDQSTPFNADAEGIWEIDGTELMYEVVQTGLGFTAPTPEGGFGSTSGPNLEPGDNVQIFR